MTQLSWGVAGDSGSGKTTFSNGIRRLVETHAATSYKVSLILEPPQTPLPPLPLPFNLAAMLELNQPSFLLAAVPFRYWGRTAIAIHIDASLSPQTIGELDHDIVQHTGIPMQKAIFQEEHKKVSATHFAQLLVTWRFLEQVGPILTG